MEQTKISKIKTLKEAYAQTEAVIAESAWLFARIESIYEECVPYEPAAKIRDDGADLNKAIIQVKATLQMFEKQFETGELVSPKPLGTPEEFIVDHYNGGTVDGIKEVMRKLRNAVKRMERYREKNKEHDDAKIKEIKDGFAQYKKAVQAVQLKVEEALAKKDKIGAARALRQWPLYFINRPIGGLKKDPETKQWKSDERKYDYIAEEFTEFLAWKKRIETKEVSRTNFIMANYLDKKDELEKLKFDFKSDWKKISQSFIDQPPYQPGAVERDRFEKNDDLLINIREHHRNIYNLEQDIARIEEALKEEKAATRERDTGGR